MYIGRKKKREETATEETDKQTGGTNDVCNDQIYVRWRFTHSRPPPAPPIEKEEQDKVFRKAPLPPSFSSRHICYLSLYIFASIYPPMCMCILRVSIALTNQDRTSRTSRRAEGLHRGLCLSIASRRTHHLSLYLFRTEKFMRNAKFPVSRQELQLPPSALIAINAALSSYLSTYDEVPEASIRVSHLPCFLCYCTNVNCTSYTPCMSTYVVC